MVRREMGKTTEISEMINVLVKKRLYDHVCFKR